MKPYFRPVPVEPTTSPPQRLVGWKDIAAYLGRSVRAVQRWERELGLPVHRVRSASGQTVYALRQELDEWLSRVDTGPPSEEAPTQAVHRWWPAVLAAAMVVATVVAFLGLTRTGGTAELVTSLRLRGSVVEAISDAGRVAWTHELGGRATLPAFRVTNLRLRDPVFADLDGDGSDELIAALRVERAGRPATEGIYCWDQSGRLRWKYEPDAVLEFAGGARFGPSWQVADFAAVTGNDAGVWASFSDGTWWADFVSQIAPDGATSVRLVHGGIVYRLLPQTVDGATLVLGATVSNLHASAGLVVLDPAAAAGRWPVEPSGYQCVDCPAGTPARYVLLPPSDVVQADGAASNNVLDLVDSGGTVNLITREERDTFGSAARVFRFTPRGEPFAYAPTDAFAVLHRAYESRGVLVHPAERCPAAVRPVSARVWTPQEGWRERALRVEPLSVFANRARPVAR